tara:strand:- start:3431 stop:3838 length:408 start_codon:yes stop_codon:yes gene_type:complete
MCFNKKAQSSAQTDTTTINRDERLAADGGSTITSAKDGGTSLSTVATAGTADAVFAAAPDSVINYQGMTAEALAAVFDFAQGVTRGAGDFAANTQAAYQTAAASANTQDSTEIVQKMMLGAVVILVAYFYFQGTK